MDLSDKPWFTTDPDASSLAVETTRNLSIALAAIPAETRQAMGHTLDDMLQACKWDSKNCGPR